MKHSNTLFTVSASLLLALTSTQSWATSTDVVLNLEGNPTCSSLGDNSQILEYRDSSPGGTKSVILSTVDGGTQVLDYEVGIYNNPEDPNDPGNGLAAVLFWEISSVSTGSEINPINYTILKAQGGNGARVFHFGAAEDGDGAIEDENELARSSRMAAVSFCYGLTTGFGPVEPPPPAVSIPTCEELAQQGDTLDGTGIVCPVDSTEERLLINMELYAPNFGFDDAFHACTCNVPDGLPTCDPEKSVNEEGACLISDGLPSDGPDGVDNGVNVRIPIIIEAVENPDSYICYTIGGRRTCYGHF